MKKVALAAGLIFLTGCLVRTYTVEKPRVDLDIQGNRGYLTGEPKDEISENKFGDKRIVSVMEIELGSHSRSKSEEKTKASSFAPEKTQEETESLNEEYIEQPASTENYEYYTIEKNDTLQKISKKFYGTTKKWHMIYQENRDILKSPDKLYPGVKIKIPLD